MRHVTHDVLNKILEHLAPPLRDYVIDQCNYVNFSNGHTICSEGSTAQYVYFIERGLVALVKRMHSGKSIESGLIGNEGFVGLFAADGVSEIIADYIAAIPTCAFRISHRNFRDLLEHHAVLGDFIQKYRRFTLEQVLRNAACIGLHSLTQRYASWLLIAHDNAKTNSFSVTHEFLAFLLGVQRPSISTVAMKLQHKELIRYSHGQITIIDRAGLEALACECYRVRSKQIDRFFGCSSLTVL